VLRAHENAHPAGTRKVCGAAAETRQPPS
jgi:hypothetical protein